MRTPGLYSDIKVATQRNQLPNQAHKIIFINTDVPKEIPPTDIFDTVEADTKTAKSQSNAGRMMAAALMVSQGVDVEMATWTRAIAKTSSATIKRRSQCHLTLMARQQRTFITIIKAIYKPHR